MVPATQQDEIVEIGRTAMDPVHEVMSISRLSPRSTNREANLSAPARRALAPWEDFRPCGYAPCNSGHQLIDVSEARQLY